MSVINFKAKPYKIGSNTVVQVPKEASLKLPSRGQVMVRAAINGFEFMSALEPDGRGSHWLNLTKSLQKSTKTSPDKTIEVRIEASKEWPEPVIPNDIKKRIANSSDTKALWERITPMARWEWIRWIQSTNYADTRANRIDVSRSKLLRGERRPCCFNRNMCCVPEVSKNGVLIQPT